MHHLYLVYLVHVYVNISIFPGSMTRYCYHVSFSAMSGYGFSTSVSFGSQRPHLTECSSTKFLQVVKGSPKFFGASLIFSVVGGCLFSRYFFA